MEISSTVLEIQIKPDILIHFGSSIRKIIATRAITNKRIENEEVFIFNKCWYQHDISFS
jgi:hypothetical protein